MRLVAKGESFGKAPLKGLRPKGWQQSNEALLLLPASLYSQPGTSIRAERTPEAVAVSGYTGEVQGERLSSPGIPGTNLNDINIGADDPARAYLKLLRLHYLEHEATSPTPVKSQAQKPTGRICGCLALLGEDSDGNRIAKRLPCGREWCLLCRDIAHKRRIARVLTRLMQIYPMAYDDITFPLEVRPLLHNPKMLTLIAKKVRKLYRRQGYRKLYVRWHFWGDKSPVYNPHLNVLYDGEWLPPEQLAIFKDAIRRALLPRSISKRISKDLVINHQYTRNPKKMMNWIRYVTRATFLDREWDEPLAEALYGFHNGCFAGTWKDPQKWRLTGSDKKYNPLLKLAENLHPVSGKPITWTRKPIPFVLVLMEEPVDIGGWYYLLPPIRPPPVLPEETTQRLYRLKQEHRLALKQAQARADAAADTQTAFDNSAWSDILKEGG